MLNRKMLTILIILIHICTESGSENVEPKKNVNSTFVATNQWKKIEEGQAISPGLHVRINLKTGEKEAKLPDPDEDSDKKKSLVATTKESDKIAEGSQAFDPKELKKMLKKIRPDDAESSGEVKKKFRSYEKLKEEFDKIKVQVKSDYEILVGLIENFKQFSVRTKYNRYNVSSEWTKDDEIITALTDMEYLVHQINNAQEFARLNGFSEVVYKSLNSSNSEVRSEALKLLGSATQSNPSVQIAALESGSINLLIKILTFDDSISVRSRSLYALSCLIRRFPMAQQKFIADGGLTAFAKIFDEEKHDLLKLQIRVVTLLHDLLFERKDAKMSLSNKENKQQTDKELEDLREKLRQYEKMKLEQKLVEQDWCKRISDWFLKQNQVKEVVSSANLALSGDNLNFDSDVISGVVETLYVLSDICKSEFQNDIDLVMLLSTLKDVYSKLALEESKLKGDTTNFYSSLSNILKMLLAKLSIENTQKDEL